MSLIDKIKADVKKADRIKKVYLFQRRTETTY